MAGTTWSTHQTHEIMEMELLQQFLLLSQQELYGSVMIMGDLLLSNPGLYGSSLDQHMKILLSYADSLCADLQYRRALHYYKEALKTLKQIEQSEMKANVELLPTEGEVKWRMYKCHMHLKESPEALEVLSSIPLRQRDAKVAMALAKLYHHYKNDSRCALICYKQALSMSPLAIEAILGLLSLGMTLPEVRAIATSKGGPGASSCVLTNTVWLDQWLEAQASFTRQDYNGAVDKFEHLSKMGFNMSAEGNSQLAVCMLKLGKNEASQDLFAKAHIQDPFNLKHMDTYARLLSSKPKLERLSASLLYASSLHPQPWMANAWQLTRNKDIDPQTRAKATTFATKACLLDPKNAEAPFLLASIAMTKNDLPSSIKKYSEAIHLDPTFFAAYEPLIRCYLIQRREKEAMNVTRLAAKHLTLPQQLFLEGLALSQKSQTIPKAKLALEKAIKFDKTFEKAVILLSDIYLKELNNTEKAIEMLSAHLQKYASPALHCKLGSCYIKLFQYDKAIDHFQMAIRLDSTYEKAIELLKKTTCMQQHNDEMANLESDSDLDLEVEEREDVVFVGPANHAPQPVHLEMDSDESGQMMDLVGQDYQW